jgi:hypothetical protein
MYTSTRDGGTCIFRSISPTRFHRACWNLERTNVGKFVGEKEYLPVVSGSAPEETMPKETRRASRTLSSLGTSSGTLARLVNLFRNLCDGRKSTRCSQPRAVVTSREKRTHSRAPATAAFQDTMPGLIDKIYVIPHPIFARKHSLVSQGKPLPPSITTHLMRTADFVSPDMTSAATETSVFRGPFTPQLGFDGGHDFEWDASPSTSSTSVKVGTGGLFSSQTKTLNSGAAPHAVRRHNARQAHDWFGLDAGLLDPRCLPTTGQGNKKQPTHGYNWFGLE